MSDNSNQPGVKTFVVRDRAPSDFRQHGAMEFSEPPVDLDIVRSYRYGRVQAALNKRGLAGILMYDQLNARYAIDATNMQIWCSHNENRYVYVPATGGAVIFDYGGKTFLSEGLPNIAESRPALPFYYFKAGPEIETRARMWAQEIYDLVLETSGGNKRIALDRLSPLGVQELEKLGLQIHDGFEVMENARKIKSAEELVLMQVAIDATEDAMQYMREGFEPGVTENALLARLQGRNVELGGEWMETRLLASGPRTNPWFRESSMRPIEKGEIMAFDTDMVGPYGYCADLSRTWVCGVNKASDEQRRLHEVAMSQIEYNKSLIKAGITFRELAERCWPIPDEFLEGRYGVAIHGVGLCDEYPAIKHWVDHDVHGYDGVMEEGMCLCVESYIGAESGYEGIKLEEQIVVTKDGFEQFSRYPPDDALM